MNFWLKSGAAGCLIVMLAILAGCAYRDLNPEAAAAEKRALDESLRSVTPGAAKLILRGSGAGHAVAYSVSVTGETCQGFEAAGNVANSGRGAVFPWIARLNERTRSRLFRTQPYIEREVNPGPGVQVQATGRWQQANTPATLPVRTGRCGPLFARFLPTAGHVYDVDFAWRDGLSCALVITDSTVPGAQVPEKFDVAHCPTSEDKRNESPVVDEAMKRAIDHEAPPRRAPSVEKQ